MGNNEYFKIAKNAVKLAGLEVLNYYGKHINIEYKRNNSPLTQADLASNKILLNLLKETSIPVLSEEGKDDLSRLNSEKVWIIDPLDGTKDFIQESGEFTIMAALTEKNKPNIYRPIIGLIYLPVKKILYFAIKGEGAWQELDNGKKKKLQVSARLDWEDIIMLTSRNHSTDLEKTVAMNLGINKFKSFGSSLKACMIAANEGDLNFNPAPYTWEWDVCASDLIICEAGGKFTDILGSEFDYNKKDPRNINGYFASNGLIHDKILEQLKI
jgi:3'(2'), 5'-bisphosphate nucleotidase